MVALAWASPVIADAMLSPGSVVVGKHLDEMFHGGAYREFV